MKTIIIILIYISTCTIYAQVKKEDGIYAELPINPISNNFSISKNNIITWEKNYDTFDNEIINKFRSNKNFIFLSDSTGTCNDIIYKGNNLSMYTSGSINFSFKIKIKKNKYNIVADNFIYKNIDGNILKRKYIKIESEELKKNNTLRLNEISSRNFDALNEFLIQLFNIKNINESKW